MTTLNNYDKNSPIGFFDSGVGGLTVLDKLEKLLPNETYVYYGDTLHMPYGEKSKEDLLNYSINILNFFQEKGCKAVVMACNTTSSTVYEDLKDKYSFKLFPIVQSVSKILSELPVSSIGVFATRATINSQAYRKGITKYNSNIKIYEQFCPKWVHFVEENSFNNPENIEVIKNDLEKMLVNNPQKIVLGCTHYPFLLGILSKFADEKLFIDPAIPFAEFIKETLIKENLISDNNTSNIKNEFYVSSNPVQFKLSAEMFYNLKKIPELLNF